MAESELDQQYTDRFNEAADLYEKDQWRKCLEVCEDMLKYRGALSRNLRIRVLVLAAGATDDFWDAEEWRKEAEHLWSVGRRLFPPRPKQDPSAPAKSQLQQEYEKILPQPHYADDSTEETLQDLRELLDDLSRVQEEEKKWIGQDVYQVPSGWTTGSALLGQAQPPEPSQSEKEDRQQEATQMTKGIEDDAAKQEQEATMIDEGAETARTG